MKHKQNNTMQKSQNTIKAARGPAQARPGSIPSLFNGTLTNRWHSAKLILGVRSGLYIVLQGYGGRTGAWRGDWGIVAPSIFYMASPKNMTHHEYEGNTKIENNKTSHPVSV